MKYRGRIYKETNWVEGELLEEKNGNRAFIINPAGFPVMVDADSVHVAPPKGLHDLFDIEEMCNPERIGAFSVDQYLQIMKWATENIMGGDWRADESLPISIIDPRGFSVERDERGIIIAENGQTYTYNP